MHQKNVARKKQNYDQTFHHELETKQNPQTITKQFDP